MMLLCSPQQLPLYKEELEIYFSPGRMCVSLHCLAAFSYTLIKPLPLARLSHSNPSFCDTPPQAILLTGQTGT